MTCQHLNKDVDISSTGKFVVTVIYCKDCMEVLKIEHTLKGSEDGSENAEKS